MSASGLQRTARIAAGSALAGVVIAGVSAMGIGSGRVEGSPERLPTRSNPAPPARPVQVAWIAVGGGAEPSSNQISLEDDLLMVADVFGRDRGLMLFAGGAGTRSVQVASDSKTGFRTWLGDFLDPRGGRYSTYHSTRLAVHGDASASTLQRELVTALSRGADPLTLWVATHGAGGEEAWQSEVVLWGGSSLDAVEFYEILSERSSDRELRLVVTACYSGGLAELAFSQADPSQGPTELELCGLFATNWDREASGCDPDPDRAAHESWSIYLLHGLAGIDRDGRTLDLDFDHDGAISLVEADAYARVEADSIDVPISMSERLLRELGDHEFEFRGRPDPADVIDSAEVGESSAATSESRGELELADQEYIVVQLGARYGLDELGAAASRLEAMESERQKLEAEAFALRERVDQSWAEIRAVLLSEWPTLDDPWHPEFESTWARERPRIERYFRESEAIAALQSDQARLDRIGQEEFEWLRREAPILRWMRAKETIGLATRLASRGGEGFERWQRMRRCEAARP